MEIDVEPEPSADEREAILAALAAADEPPQPGVSAWRRAALEEAVEAPRNQSSGSDVAPA